jgi:hypothetical protein
MRTSYRCNTEELLQIDKGFLIKARLINIGVNKHVARMGERLGAYWVLVGKPGGKRQLWRLRHRWENNIKMDIQGVGCGGYGLDRGGSEQGQVAGTSE